MEVKLNLGALLNRACEFMGEREMLMCRVANNEPYNQRQHLSYVDADIALDDMCRLVGVDRAAVLRVAKTIDKHNSWLLFSGSLDWLLHDSQAENLYNLLKED